MRITHVVVTDAFAGTERYVCEVARRQAERGHDVRVLGGDPARMPSELGAASFAAAGSWPTAAARLVAGGRRDVVHAHLTSAELAASLTKPAHGAAVVTTRHIAARRGRTRLGKLAVPVVERGVDVQIAISAHVAEASGDATAVLHNGVGTCDVPYDIDSRTVLLTQRLEPEKDTATALRAWATSGLGVDGWQLLVAGDGQEREQLQTLAAELSLQGVRFLGRVDDVPVLLARSAILLATATSEPLGLSVLEAMANGVPVVATGSGGHLETLPAQWPYLFPPGDASTAGEALRRLAASDVDRQEASRVLRSQQRSRFDVERHVSALLELYPPNPATRRGPRR